MECHDSGWAEGCCRTPGARAEDCQEGKPCTCSEQCNQCFSWSPCYLVSCEDRGECLLTIYHLYIPITHSVLQLQRTHDCAQMEYLLIGLHSTIDQFSPPNVFFTSERIPHFFQTQFGLTLSELAIEAKGYLLSGVHSQYTLLTVKLLNWNSLVLQVLLRIMSRRHSSWRNRPLFCYCKSFVSHNSTHRFNAQTHHELCSQSSRYWCTEDDLSKFWGKHDCLICRCLR